MLGQPADPSRRSSRARQSRYKASLMGLGGSARIPADRRGYRRALEPFLVRTELADRGLRARSATRTHGSPLCQRAVRERVLGWRVAGPGSGLSEEPATGVGPVTLDVRVVPECPPGPVCCGWWSRIIWW